METVSKTRKQVIALVALVVFNVGCWAYPVSQKFWNNVYDADGHIGPPLSFSFEEKPQLPLQLQGDGERTVRLLYRDYIKVYGENYAPRNQSGPTCVGHSTAAAIDFLGAIEVVAGHRAVPPPSRANAAWIYATSRDLGGLGTRTGGSYARLSVRALNEVGFLYNENFFMLGYDLTENSYDREWRRGIPPELSPMATNYITGYFQLHNYEDVRDAIHAGMPVVIGSSVGFGRINDTIYRDRDGFLREPMFRLFGKYWLHAMCLIGECDIGRPGVLCLNSWGSDWVAGPKRFGDEPEGSYWIDKVTIDKMCRGGDCFCIYGLRRSK